MEIPISELNSTQVTLSLIDVYKEDFLWILLAFMTGGGIFFLSNKVLSAVLKSVPFFQSPDLKLVLKRLDDIEKKIELNILSVLDILERVIQKFHSDLTPDQVEIVLKFAFEVTQTGMIRAICTTLEDSLDLEDDEKVESIKHSCRNIITIVDRELDKLPNMQRAMVNSDEKMITLTDSNYFQMIIEKFNSAGFDSAKREAKKWLSNIVTEEWYAR